MEDTNELSDIVLNKSSSSNSNKKIILAIATLGVVLIVVVMLMNSIHSNGTNNLPQAVIPPEPKTQQSASIELEQEPLFEEVAVIQEDETPTQELDKVVQKLKEQSSDVTEVAEPIITPVKTVHKKEMVTRHTAVKPRKETTRLQSTQKSGIYFIQVGSFSKYKPNKKFLDSISKLGYKYTYHKVKNINKVLVGPFNSLKDAHNARKILRSKVEPGAFLVKL